MFTPLRSSDDRLCWWFFVPVSIGTSLRSPYRGPLSGANNEACCRKARSGREMRDRRWTGRERLITLGRGRDQEAGERRAMTESEWLTCTNPMLMLEFLQGKGSGRKLRLFACACCRRVVRLLSEKQYRDGLAVAERIAEGVGTEAERAEASVSHPWYSDLVGCALIADPFEAARAAQYYAAKAVRIEVSNDKVNTAWITERTAQTDLLRDIFGQACHPILVDPDWLTSTVVTLARVGYDDRAFDRLPILADALEDSGCTDQTILDHCRSGGEHVRGCWVLDLLLDKE